MAFFYTSFKIWHMTCQNFKVINLTSEFLIFLVDVCTQPTDPGPCEVNVTRWAFDPKAGRCKRFNYGGCFGNENNFDSKLKCNQRCPPIGKHILAKVCFVLVLVLSIVSFFLLFFFVSVFFALTFWYTYFCCQNAFI